MKERGGGWGLLALGTYLGRRGVVVGEAWTHRVEQTDVEKPPLTQVVVVGCELPGQYCLALRIGHSIVGKHRLMAGETKAHYIEQHDLGEP